MPIPFFTTAAALRFLREDLEGWLTEERCALLEIAAEVRRDLKNTAKAPTRQMWQQALADNAIGQALAQGDREAARVRLLALLAADS